MSAPIPRIHALSLLPSLPHFQTYPSTTPVESTHISDVAECGGDNGW